MPHIDFDDEPAYHWFKTVRSARAAGVEHKLPTRLVHTPFERERAQAIHRRLNRTVLALPAVPAGESEAPSEDSTPACSRCGATDTDLRLSRSIWPRGHARIDLWVCRFGCSA